MDAFRKSMGELHTWAGVICAAGLFAMFWMGTLSVFDREIDHWMKPEIRVTGESAASLDLLRPALDGLGEQAPQVWVYPPGVREPAMRIGYVDDADTWRIRYFHPKTGVELTPPDTLAGTGFIFPFHFSFHIDWMGLGYWIAGFLAMAMLVLIVSGVFIHRKIITDFFIFRPKKQLRRATLDLHNMTAMIALPFHFILPLTGLIIFFSIYLPWSIAVPFMGDTAPLFAEMYGTRTADATGEKVETASLDRIVASAVAVWQDRYGEPVRPDMLFLDRWGDAGGEITARRVFPSRQVTMDLDAITFNADADIIADFSAGPVRTAHAWLSGLHFIQFDHWPLRWLYFLAGLSGCTMIATGLLFWMRARTARNGAEPVKVRAIRGLTVGATTGIIAATGAFFIVNRLLPHEASLAGIGRAELEVWVFFLVWIGTFIHAAIREKAAWADQALVIAVFSLLAVLLNWITTGDHPAAAAGRGLWSVAGMDLVLIAAGAAALTAALRLRMMDRTATAGKDRRHAAERIAAE